MKFGDNMKTIKNDTIYEYIIKKSKFITYLYYHRPFLFSTNFLVFSTLFEKKNYFYIFISL